MRLVMERVPFTEVDGRGDTPSRIDTWRADCECGLSSGPQLVRAEALQWWATHQYEHHAG